MKKRLSLLGSILLVLMAIGFQFVGQRHAVKGIAEQVPISSTTKGDPSSKGTFIPDDFRKAVLFVGTGLIFGILSLLLLLVSIYRREPGSRFVPVTLIIFYVLLYFTVT
jgi:hypothetical protein